MKLIEFYKEEYLKEWVLKRCRPGTIAKKLTVFEKYILPMFGDRELDSFKKLDWVRFENYLRINAKLGPKTIRNHQSDLRHILNIAVNWEYITRFPRIDLVKVEVREAKPVDADNLNKLYCAAAFEPEHTHAMFVFALQTGLRIGELRGLQWGDFNTEDTPDGPIKTVTVQRSVPGKLDVVGPTKSGRKRVLPLNQRAHEVCDLIHSGQEGSVFVFSKPDKPFLPLTYKAVNYALKRICKRAGVKAIGWHALRHTVCSTMLANDVSVYKARDVMGHVDIRTTLGYAKIKGADLLSAVSSLDQLKRSF